MYEVFIIALVAYMSWKEWLHFKERRDLAKLLKSKDMNDVTRFVFPEKEDKPILQPSDNWVELDQMPDNPSDLQGEQ